MPFGELPVTGASIPQYIPPYTTGLNHFKISCIALEYYTTAEAAKKVLPEVLEIDETPLCKSTVFTYHMSTVGQYNEYVHSIEVTWKNKKYDYVVCIILDNESALVAGREQWGLPKVLGNVELRLKTGTAHMIGYVERPKGQHAVQVGFTPMAKVTGPRPDKVKQNLTLRIIPSPADESKPDIKELSAGRMQFTGGDLWTGRGSIAFPVASEYNPFAAWPVVKYGNASYLDNADAVLYWDQSWKL